MAKQRIRIRLKAFDHKILDQSASQIVETAERTGAQVAGPGQAVWIPARRRHAIDALPPHGKHDGVVG